MKWYVVCRYVAQGAIKESVHEFSDRKNAGVFAMDWAEDGTESYSENEHARSKCVQLRYSKDSKGESWLVNVSVTVEKVPFGGRIACREATIIEEGDSKMGYILKEIANGSQSEHGESP